MSTSPEVQVRPFVPGTLTDRAAREDRAPAGRGAGFVAGYATGYSEGLRRAAEAVAAQERARELLARRELDRLRDQAGQLLLSLRAGALQLQEQGRIDTDGLAELVAGCAAELAEQVVLDAAPTADALLARIRRGIVDAPLGTAVTVRVAPAGVRALERAGVLPDELPDGVVVLADERLEVGDVVVRAGAATVTDLLRPAVAAAVGALAGDRR